MELMKAIDNNVDGILMRHTPFEVASVILRKCIFILVFAIGTFIFAPLDASTKITNDYRDPNLSINERIDALLSLMTVEEKIAQLDMLNGRPLANGIQLDTGRSISMIGTDGIGAVHDFYPVSPDLSNELQAFIIENNRFGIPALIVEETLHGYVQEGSTTFPIPLALAATWNSDLVKNVGHAIASEARANGTTVGLSPVLGIAREPRWGRVEETFGEDTWLAASMGRAMVEGLQGNDLTRPDAIASVVKHFAVHSVPTSGTNSSPGYIGRREALQYFLPVFRTAIVDGGARGVMTAYSEWNGVPCTGDPWLLTDLLRKQWGFTGFTLADMGAIRMLSTCHFVTTSPSSSLQRAISAGMDMQFYDFPSTTFRNEMEMLVQSGNLELRHLDRAVGNILRLKFELGLFEDPFVDPNQAAAVIHSEKHQQLALKAAREAVVLLKSDDILPIDSAIKRIAVVGPAAKNSYTGGYSPKGASGISVLDGLREIADKEIEIRHVQGVSFIDEGVPIPGRVLRTIDNSESGLNASYFSNISLSGNPTLSRIDPQVDFYWDTHSPSSELPPDSFSVRWEGWLIPEEDFSGWIGLSSDDGSRLWLEEKLIIDSWQSGATIRSAEVNLRAGSKYRIKMEYREDKWGASAGLRWNKGADNIDEAVDLAHWADIVVASVGENDLLIGENRDRLSLELSGNQPELLKAILQTNTPVVIVLSSGRPVALGRLGEMADAVVASWFSGEYTGQAVAEILFGEVNPSGKLPVTFPKSTGQIPCYYNTKPSKIMRYSDGDAQPLYPFGHGLSYSRFEYSELKLAKRSLSVDDTLRFSIKIENISDLSGHETIQIYVNDLYSTVTTPLKDLKDFKKISLEAKEVKTILFKIPIARFSFVNTDFEEVVEPGKFELMIGSSSKDIRLKTFFTVTEISP